MKFFFDGTWDSLSLRRTRWRWQWRFISASQHLLSKSRVDILKMFIAPSWRAFYDALRVMEQPTPPASLPLRLLQLQPIEFTHSPRLYTLSRAFSFFKSLPMLCSAILASAWIASFTPSTHNRRPAWWCCSAPPAPRSPRAWPRWCPIGT